MYIEGFRRITLKMVREIYKNSKVDCYYKNKIITDRNDESYFMSPFKRKYFRISQISINCDFEIGFNDKDGCWYFILNVKYLELIENNIINEPIGGIGFLEIREERKVGDFIKCSLGFMKLPFELVSKIPGSLNSDRYLYINQYI